MRKKYEITEEEFTAISEAVRDVLQLWHYDLIEAQNESGASIGMSVETFFKNLRTQFIIHHP